MGRNTFTLFLFILFFAYSASATNDIILNGTSFYLSTGGSYVLAQGYVITIKSVSNDGSAWIELTSKDAYIKSEIIHINDLFTYNKTNRTILSMKIDNIYSGSDDKNLVSFFPVYQYMDPDKPAPEIIEITPVETQVQENENFLQRKDDPEAGILVIGVLFILFMSYIIYKLW
ncbi:MAG: S-layer protein domain-containing protein [Candidatus Methanoperedens sp.]|nr:S-layer protein domain-containing protein [Candidatus Methanoperedens sp.]